MNRSLDSCKYQVVTSCNWYFPIVKLMGIIKAPAVLQHSYCRFSRRSAFILLWYRTHWVRYFAHGPEKKELAYVSAYRVSRISESAVQCLTAWVKETKSICQVKGQPEIIHPVKSQGKYLVSQSFDLGWRLEYMIYRSATPLQYLVSRGFARGAYISYNTPAWK